MRQQTPQDSKRQRYQQTRRDKFLIDNMAQESEWAIYRRWKRFGIDAEFFKQPPVYPYPNKFTPVDKDMLEGIQHMQQQHWITEIKDWQRRPGFYSKLKLVKKDSGKWRSTLACMEINKLTMKRHFKSDDLRSLKEILEPGMFMALLDIKDAFYSKTQVLVRSCRKYFRFAIKTKQGIQAFEFMVTPQGWSTSARAFHIMMKEVTKEANHLGIQHCRATDDVIIVDHNERRCGRKLEQFNEILHKHGFEAKKEKEKRPARKQIWYGALVETHPYVKFSVTKAKRKEMKRCAAWTIKNNQLGRLTPRMVAGFVGKIRAAQLSLECAMAHSYNLIHMQTRALAANDQDWDAPFYLSDAAIKELEFFQTRCNYPGRYMATNLIEILLVSDASNSGYGGKILRIPEDWKKEVQHAVMGFWTGVELQMHINEKEHEGSFRVAQGCLNPARDFVKSLPPTVYHLNMITDNQVSKSYHNKQGGKSSNLNQTTLAFQTWATQQFYPSEMVITSTYLEGDKMIAIGGDELSRMGRLGEEIQLNPKIFKTLCRLLQFKPNIDLFATEFNYQLPRYYSPHHDRQAEATNAMIQEWKEPSYAFPPLKMIPNLLQKIQQDKATVLAVLPITPSARWYPQLQRLVASQPVHLVQGRKTFRYPNEYLKPLKQWSKWSWIGVILSWSKSPRTREWRLTMRRKWLRRSGKRTPDQAIGPDGKSFSIGTKENTVMNRLCNLSLSSALSTG